VIKKRILDIGAGGNPDIRATDAIDRLKSKSIERERREFFEKGYFYKKKFCKERGYCKEPPKTRPKLNNKTKYLYNINFNQDKLPYDDNSIDIIISYHAISAFGGKHAIKEIYRILKPGGHVDIGWFNNKNNDKFRGKIMKSGLNFIYLHYQNMVFKHVKVFRNTKNNSLYDYQFTLTPLTIIRAYKGGNHA